MSQYIVQGIFAVAGIIALLAAILDWNWFFTARNTQFIVQNVGRRQARLFYGAHPRFSYTFDTDYSSSKDSVYSISPCTMKRISSGS